MKIIIIDIKNISTILESDVTELELDPPWNPIKRNNEANTIITVRNTAPANNIFLFI
ncbi:MAG: hypothetical protein ACXAEU_26390 [Candidatus Hodarchaeales archaeon]|jgi:hypothetical protein